MPKKTTAPLPKRPTPPTLEQIQQDINGAKNDDTAFTFFRNIENDESPNHERRSNSMMAESFHEEEMEEGEESGDSESSDKQDAQGILNKLEVQMLYKKAIQFIDVNEQLKSAPETLKEQFKHLEELGGDLEKTAEELRQQAKVVFSQSYQWTVFTECNSNLLRNTTDLTANIP